MYFWPKTARLHHWRVAIVQHEPHHDDGETPQRSTNSSATLTATHASGTDTEHTNCVSNCRNKGCTCKNGGGCLDMDVWGTTLTTRTYVLPLNDTVPIAHHENHIQLDLAVLMFGDETF